MIGSADEFRRLRISRALDEQDRAACESASVSIWAEIKRGQNPMLKGLAVALSAGIVLSHQQFAFAQSLDNTQALMPSQNFQLLKQWLDAAEDNGWEREPICMAMLLQKKEYCQTITFHKFLPQTKPYSSIWTRNEYFQQRSFNGQFYKSDVWLMEIDCVNKRSRPIQTTEYTESNMGGTSFSPPVNTNWFYAVPGTSGETEVSLTCSDEFRKNFTINNWRSRLTGQPQ